MDESYVVERLDKQDERIKDLYDKIDKIAESKTPSKLFYFFVGTFTLTYIIGMILVYQQTTKNTLIIEKGIAGVRITQTELKERVTYTSIKAEQIETSVFRLQDKLDKAISDIREELRKK